MKIFFDLDGTLIDVAPRHYQLYTEVTKLFGGTPLSQKEYWDLKRSKAKWPDILPKTGLPADIVEYYLAEFRQRVEDPAYLRIDELFPGALEAVAQLAGEHTCYLISLRRNSESLKLQLEWLGLAPHFNKLLTAHSESDGYDVKIPMIRAELGTGKGVIIGDTEADIVTGKQLGLTTVAVLSGLRTKELLAVLEPDHVVATVAELPALLQRQ